MKANIFKCLFAALLLACLLASLAATAQGATVVDTATLQAAVYSDATCTNLVTELTEGGSFFSNWTYNTTRYLKLSLEQLDADAQYQLVIEMEHVLYLDAVTEIQQATTKGTQNAPITVNTNASYTPKSTSFASLIYEIDHGVEGFSFALPFRYDNVLWDKQKDSTLADLDTEHPAPILRVYLQKIEGGTAQTIEGSYSALNTVITGAAIPDTHYIQYKDAAGKVSSNGPNVAYNSYALLEFSHFSNSFYNELNYYDQLVFKLTLPSATVNGNTVYANAVFESFGVSAGTADYETEVSEDTVTIRMGKSLFTTTGFAKIKFTFPDVPDLSSIMDVIVFSGRIEVFVNHSPLFNQPISLNLNNNPDPILSAITGRGEASTYAMDVVQYMGTYGIDNAGGTKNSGVHIKMEFDSTDTNAVGITSIRLLRASGNPNKQITVTYTLVDKNGNPYASGQAFSLTISDISGAASIDNNTNILLNRSHLPAEQREYYFKTIEYDLPIVRASSNYYARSATKAYSGAGTFWGHVLKDQTYSSGQIMHVITVTDPDLDHAPISKLCTQISTVINSARAPSYAMDNAAVSATSIDAGNGFSISGKVSVATYPYGSYNCLSNIRVGFLMPKGVSVNEATIQCSLPTYTPTVSQKDVDTDHVFWMIEFTSDIKLGYATESLNPIAGGTAMTYTVGFNTDKSVASQKINLLESVFVAGNNQPNSAGGSYQPYAITDTYDLNGDGRTTDKIGRFAATTTASINIIGAPAQLDATATIRKASNGTTSDVAVMESYADEFFYDLTIANNSSGTASDFYYLIPISSTDLGVETEEEHFLAQKDANFTLIATPICNSNNSNFLLYYSIKEFSTYSEAADSVVLEPLSGDPVWILLDGSLSDDILNKITMLMVTTIGNAPILPGDSVTVSMRLDYNGEDIEYVYDAGSKSVWSSRGYYNYQAVASSMTGHISSNEVAISLQTIIVYVDEDSQTDLESVHLTADANSTANKTDSFELQAFENKQVYRIGEIKLTGVTLIDYSNPIPDPNSNDTFGIQLLIQEKDAWGNYVTLPGNEETSLHALNTIVGTVSNATEAKFIFDLNHGQAISQNTEGLKANIILLGDMGVVIDITIEIHRVLTQATAGESGLFAGEVYIMQDDALQESVSISNRSTLTAQFSNKNVTPNNYGTRVLTFTEALPQGTIITMADLTDTAAPKYYYYPVSVSNLTSLELTAFYEMGSSSTPYQYSTLNENIYETFLFIFSFPTNQTLSHTSTITFTLSPTPEASASDPTLTEKVSEAYGFSVQGATTFSLTTQERVVNYGDSFTLTVTSTPPANDVPDNYYYSQRMTLVLQSSSPNAPLPSDATLFVEDKEYHPDLYGRFIIPLESVGDNAKTLTRTMRFRSFAQPFATLHASLYTHNGAEGLPFGGATVGELVTVTIQPQTLPAFRVTRMPNRILHRNVELKADVLLGIQLQNIGANDNDIVTLEIQQKTASAYSTMTTALNTLNGSAEHRQGVFFVQIPPVEDPSNPYDQSLSLRFNSNIPAGTYRVLFTVTTRGHSMTVPYEFIVAE